MAAQTYRKLLLAGAALLVLLLAGYGAVLPRMMYRHYRAQLEPAIQELHTHLVTVSAGVAEPVFTAPGLPSAARQQGLSMVMQQNAALRARLDQLAARAEELRVPPPGLGLSMPYRSAAAARDEVLRTVAHANRALDNYDTLLNFLGLYSTLQAQLAGDLQFASGLTRQSERLSGRFPELDAGAGRIAGYSRQLRATDIPADFALFKAAAVDTFAQSAEAFDSLAYASYLGANTDLGQIDNRLQALAAKNNQLDSELFVALAEASPALRRIAELPDSTRQLAEE